VFFAAHTIRVADIEDEKVKGQLPDILKPKPFFQPFNFSTFSIIKRRSAKTDETRIIQRWCLTVAGINSLALALVAKQRPRLHNNIRQRQELAKHTLMHSPRQLCQMPVTLVLDAFGTSHIAIIRSLMDMERRE